MVYIPISLLKPDMVLARDIPSRNIAMPLVTAGKRLTPHLIHKILKRGVQGAYIDSKQFADIEAEDFIEPEYKQELLENVKKEFDNYVKKNITPSPSHTYHAFSNMATSLVMQVMNKDKLLLNVIDIRDFDTYTYSHSMYVGLLSVIIGMNLGLPESALVDLAMCGLLHDIGKLDISIDIINKPGNLTDEELKIVREHPNNAVKYLSGTSLFSAKMIQGIKCHHEWYDGSGYPDGLAGEKIPLYGRILALSDVYDALSSSRPYRKAWTGSQIIEYMMSCSGNHFDPALFPAFLHSVAVFPVGTLVRLSNGSVGVVVENFPDFTLRPVVRLLYPAEMENMQFNLAQECLNLTIMETISGEEVGLNLDFLHPEKANNQNEK